MILARVRVACGFGPVCTHLERSKASGVLVGPAADVKYNAIALVADLVSVQPVLK